MGYGREVYESASGILRERRRQAEYAAEMRRKAFYEACPRGREIERSLSATAARAARAVLSGKDAARQLTLLKEENQDMQAQFRGLLERHGLAEKDLEPQYGCPKCRDTGYVDGRMCSCFKELLKAEAYRRLNEATPLALSTFRDFSLDYYSDAPQEGRPSDREIMADTLRFCENYAMHFSADSPNLILTGGTGLGKTHLSLAVANEAIQRGFGVVYSSAGSLISRLENEHFGRERGDTPQALQSCDLLIIDDLGTECRSAFSASAVYNTVNTRLLEQKPTIISTNLSTREMVEYYSERFASRIIGSYRRLVFVGKDVRQQKRLRKRQ